jgi:hypothetical protein
MARRQDLPLRVNSSVLFTLWGPEYSSPLAQIQHGFDCCDAQLASEMGQFLPPTFATAMEELASTPDAKARNRCAAF